MSAYNLDRSHFVAIAKFINAKSDGFGAERDKLHVYHPDVLKLNKNSPYLTAWQAANILMAGNLDSVAYRYSEKRARMKRITEDDIHKPAEVEIPARMFGRLRSLQYQSCEPNDYKKSAAYAVLIQVLWLADEVVAKEAGAEA